MTIDTDRVCLTCGASVPTNATACSSCGTRFGADQSTVVAPTPTTRPSGPPTRRERLAVGLFLIVGVAFAIVLGLGGLTPSTSVAPVTSGAPDAWTPPAGYTLTTDPTVAYHWLAQSQFRCDGAAQTCWGMNVMPRDGCPHALSVEVSILDDAGTVIGSATDSASAVGQGQHALLVFGSSDHGAARANLIKTSCD